MTLRHAGYVVLIVAVLAVGFKFGDYWRDLKSSSQIADLKTELAKTHDTIEVSHSVYLTEVIKSGKLADMLDSSRVEVAAMIKQIDAMKAQLLTTQQISLRWKKAYEDALAANQTEEPPVDPGGAPRKRVEFSGRLGPIQATGHTLTDPPEAFLKLEQVDPLVLTVSVAQNKDKTWSTFVTSSDENVAVKVDLAGVNPLVISPKWYQRIWLDVGAAAMGDPAGYIGTSWRGDRYSVGAMCYASAGSMNGCGATLGVRLFR